MSLSKFKKIHEKFEQAALVPDAIKWLKQKFGDELEFKHSPGLSNPTKSYDCSINGKEFTISGRMYDSNGDGVKNVVLFKIEPPEEEQEEEDAF